MTTHSTECYRWHHACAVAEVERLRAALAQPLTDDEIDAITRDRWGTQLLGVMVQAHREYARAIERAHGIK